MGELSEVAFVMAEEPKKAKKFTPVEKTEPAEGNEPVEVVYDADTLVRGAKLWFGVSRPRVANILRHYKANEATRAQVVKWLKG